MATRGTTKKTIKKTTKQPTKKTTKKASGKSARYQTTGEVDRRTERRSKVLVPIDFSECSRHALDFAVDYIQKVPSELYLFHVFEQVNRLSFVGRNLAQKVDAELERMEGLVLSELEKMAESEKKKLRNYHCRVASGKPWEEILKISANISADIVIMGSHGRDDMQKVLVGSQTEIEQVVADLDALDEDAEEDDKLEDARE